MIHGSGLDQKEFERKASNKFILGETPFFDDATHAHDDDIEMCTEGYKQKISSEFFRYQY